MVKVSDMYTNSNQIQVVCVTVKVSEYHCEKAEMGLDDPKLVSVHMSFDVWGACCMCVVFQRWAGPTVL